MIEYTAHYDPSKAAAAERAFFLRSIRELRLKSTLLPPIGLLVMLAIGSALGIPSWVRWSLVVFLFLAIAGPLFFYVARPLSMASQARKYPDRRVRLSPDGIFIRLAEREFDLPWHRFTRHWECGPYVALVVSPFAAVYLPKAGTPPDALALIDVSLGTAT